MELTKYPKIIQDYIKQHGSKRGWNNIIQNIACREVGYNIKHSDLPSKYKVSFLSEMREKNKLSQMRKKDKLSQIKEKPFQMREKKQSRMKNKRLANMRKSKLKQVREKSKQISNQMKKRKSNKMGKHSLYGRMMIQRLINELEKQ
jgi:dTDP-4-dehydrorhamnose reductase